MFTLTPEQWKILSSYLDQVLPLSGVERALWLESLRHENPAVATQIQALLEEHKAAEQEGFLEDTLSVPGIRQGLAGQTIGAYKLISLIGQGGMGSVWLAERSDGRFERRSALKFLSVALAGRGGEERFKREGTILGRLSHPHIAELVDAGVFGSAQPYLVLEYVDGEHIDQYCDRRQLDVEARVHLFLDVLEAVAHAHSNLIVHRDIKPSNVLVRKDGQVKLLDFGIAKLLEGEGETGQTTMLTVEAGRAMTPVYAAPEQVTGGAITTATDVYALGVLLYLLLTGQHPVGGSALSPAELLNAIVDSEAPRPSDIVTSPKASGEIATGSAARRGTTPDKLSRVLHGDLDTIVGKALKKAPGERYVSVTALADDLRRYLQHEPISARPDSIAYRASKFVRRNRTAVALSGLVVVVITVGLAGILVQARRARIQRDFALRQLVRAEAINEFNQFLLSDAEPAGKPFTANELLDRAQTVLASQHANDEVNRTELLVSIGDQYSTQDLDAKARPVLEEAYRLSRGLSEPATRAKASCAMAGALARDGDLQRAEALFNEGYHELPPDSPYALDRVFCLRRGSEIAQTAGDTREGIGRIEEAVAVLRQSMFDSDTQELQLSSELAEAFRMAGQNQQASHAFERAAALLAPLGRDRTQTALVLFNDWGLALERLGRPLEAERCYLRAIEIGSTGQTEEGVSPVLLSNYAKALYQLGRQAEAADYIDRAYSQALKVDNQMAIWQSLNAGTLIQIQRGDLVRAEKMLTELEARLRKTFPPGHQWFGSIKSVQSMLELEKGNFPRALALSNESVAIVEALVQSKGQGADYLPIALSRRAKVELGAGQPGQAAADAAKALALMQGAGEPGTSSCDAGRAQIVLGRALVAQGKQAEAVAAFRSGAEQLEHTLGADNAESRAARHLAGLEH